MDKIRQGIKKLTDDELGYEETGRRNPRLLCFMICYCSLHYIITNLRNRVIDYTLKICCCNQIVLPNS